MPVNLEEQALPTRRAAERVAKLMGISGAHQTEFGWLPGNSDEELEALLRGGISAYRLISSKGLLGRTISEAFQAGRGVGRVSEAARDGKRKIRRVSYDASAVDRDADKLVQEGTNQERRVGQTARGAVTDTTNLPDKVATEVTKVTKPKRNSVAKKRAPDFKPDLKMNDEQVEILSRLVRHDISTLEGVDTFLKKNKVFGRWRNRSEGPTREGQDRIDFVRSSLERKYGRLETLDDYQVAIKKAFPNANFEPLSILNSPFSGSRVSENVAMRKFNSEQELRDYYSDDDEGLDPIKVIKGVLDGLLFKAKQDPATAEKVGTISLSPRTAEYGAATGASTANKIISPHTVFINPTGIINVVDVSDKKALRESQLAAYYVHMRQNLQGTSAAGAIMNPAVMNGDETGNGLMIAFHEWNHLKGHVDSGAFKTPKYMDAIQEWVKTGKGKPDTHAGLIVSNEVITTEMSKLVGSTDKIQKGVAAQLFKSMGFDNVNVDNRVEVEAVYRAIAARLYVQFETDKQQKERMIKDMRRESWDIINSISGYGNTSAEEGLAEFASFHDTVPEWTSTHYPEAYDIPELKNRLK